MKLKNTSKKTPFTSLNVKWRNNISTQQKIATLEEKFLQGYLTAALWLIEDEDDLRTCNLTQNDFAPETLDSIKQDCIKFYQENKNLITEDNILRDTDCVKQSAGHDFYLTRHHHGAGFWDGDWKEKVGEKLTKASKQFKPTELYIGDDNKVYII